MKELIILEFISIVSLIFSVLANVFNFTSLNNYFLIYIWTIVISGIYGINQNKRWNKLLLIFLLAPLFIFRDINAIYFNLSLVLIIYFYAKNSLDKGSYTNYVDSLKNSIFIIMGVLVFSYLVDILNRFFDFSVPFLIIYFISTIILIRNKRHFSLGMDVNVIRRSNRLYLILIIILSSFITVEKLRTSIFSFVLMVIGSFYNFIINLVFKILYYPISIIILALERFVNWVVSRLGTGSIEDEVELLNEIEVFENIEYITKEIPIINISLKILATIAMVYIIYRLIKKTGKSKKYTVDYIEEREFIVKEGKNRVLGFKFRKPKDLNGQIRYYYQKYLIKLKKKNIELNKSNTSFEINNKAKDKFPNDTINKIRDIYIKYRYGYEECDESQVEEIKNLYKKIK